LSRRVRNGSRPRRARPPARRAGGGGLFSQGHGDFDLSLVSVGKVLDQFVPLLPQPKFLEEFVTSFRELAVGGETTNMTNFVRLRAWQDMRRFSATVSLEKDWSPGRSWRSQRRPAVGGESGDVPLKIKDPPAGGRVDSAHQIKEGGLPGPFGPMRTRLSPGSTLRLTSLTARSPPKSMVRSSRTRHGPTLSRSPHRQRILPFPFRIPAPASVRAVREPPLHRPRHVDIFFSPTCPCESGHSLLLPPPAAPEGFPSAFKESLMRFTNPWGAYRIVRM